MLQSRSVTIQKSKKSVLDLIVQYKLPLLGEEAVEELFARQA